MAVVREFRSAADFWSGMVTIAAAGPGFSKPETGPGKWPGRSAETEIAEIDLKKGRQTRAFLAGLYELADSRSAWWR